MRKAQKAGITFEQEEVRNERRQITRYFQAPGEHSYLSGGVYGDKAKSVGRFIHRFEMLDAPIQKSDSLHSCPLGRSLLPLIRSTCASDMVILVNVSILAITSVRYIIARKAVEGKASERCAKIQCLRV